MLSNGRAVVDPSAQAVDVVHCFQSHVLYESYLLDFEALSRNMCGGVVGCPLAIPVISGGPEDFAAGLNDRLGTPGCRDTSLMAVLVVCGLSCVCP